MAKAKAKAKGKGKGGKDKESKENEHQEKSNDEFSLVFTGAEAIGPINRLKEKLKNVTTKEEETDIKDTIEKWKTRGKEEVKALKDMSRYNVATEEYMKKHSEKLKCTKDKQKRFERVYDLYPGHRYIMVRRLNATFDSQVGVFLFDREESDKYIGKFISGQNITEIRKLKSTNEWYEMASSVVGYIYGSFAGFTKIAFYSLGGTIYKDCEDISKLDPNVHRTLSRYQNFPFYANRSKIFPKESEDNNGWVIEHLKVYKDEFDIGIQPEGLRSAINELGDIIKNIDSGDDQQVEVNYAPKMNQLILDLITNVKKHKRKALIMVHSSDMINPLYKMIRKYVFPVHCTVDRVNPKEPNDNSCYVKLQKGENEIGKTKDAFGNTEDVQGKIIRLWNSKDNAYGEISPIMIADLKSFSTGINLYTARDVYFLSPPESWERFKQASARPVRACKHHELIDDPRDRAVTIYMYVAKIPGIVTADVSALHRLNCERLTTELINVNEYQKVALDFTAAPLFGTKKVTLKNQDYKSLNCTNTIRTTPEES